jgi:prepilin-type N-terminal cleavage/methylation domain-containing protein
VGRRILSRGSGTPAAAAPGFTLIETMIAMAISIVVLLANLFLFTTAQKNLATSRALTDATNLATGKIAEFRTMTIAQINASAPTAQAAPNPLNARQGSDTVSSGGTTFSRTWLVSAIDLEHASPPVADMVGDLVKIRLDVTWTAANKDHHVTMTTFTTGKPL